MNAPLNRWLIRALTLCLLAVTIPTAPLQAAVIGNAELARQAQAEAAQQSLRSVLDSAALQERLQALGLDRAQVEERLGALTPAELAALEAQLDELPAGSGLLGIAVLLFVLFVITDAACATDIFSFVNCVPR
jgi:hypothetical protein